MTAPNLTGKPTRRMSKDPLKGQRQRERTFEAIAKVMSREDSGTLTMESIASRMGSTTGTLYYYFKSKGEMLYHLYMYSYELVEQAIYPIMEQEDIAPRQRLEGMIRGQMMVICDHWRLWRSLWSDTQLREVPPEFKRLIVRRRNRYLKKLTCLIEETATAEGWDCIEGRVAARTVAGIMNSISMWYKKSGHLPAEEVANFAVKCVFGGVFNKDGGQPR